MKKLVIIVLVIFAAGYISLMVQYFQEDQKRERIEETMPLGKK